MQFMNSSLEKLVKNLSDNDFKYLTEEFGSKNLELLKHVYPHMDMDNNTWTYMDSFNRLMRHKECFYRFANHGETGDHGEKLDRHISDEHLLDVHQNWMKFNMKNMGDYQDHYLKIDILSLVDVFERFINTCLKFYKLDPCHYFSSPGLSWNRMLKLTGLKLEKILDIGMYLFIEKRLRGGTSYIGKKYS